MMNGISFFPNFDIVSTTVKRSFSLHLVFTFYDYCLLASNNYCQRIRTRLECDQNVTSICHQLLAPDLFLHPPYLAYEVPACTPLVSADLQDYSPS